MTKLRKITFKHVSAWAAGMSALALLAVVLGGARPHGAQGSGRYGGGTTTLSQAKLIIEHNATDHDTGFQGFVDGEGWQSLDLVGPNGPALRIDGRGDLAKLGFTELFFESVEPENTDVPIDELLRAMPAGQYEFRGRLAGDKGEVVGTATLNHNIPAGPVLVWPAPGATVPDADLEIRWNPVTQSLRGMPVTIIAYQLIVEKDLPPHPRMIGNFSLSVYLPATSTSMTVPSDFLEPNTAYKWEVLAIEEGGNQTLSSSAFRTQ